MEKNKDNRCKRSICLFIECLHKEYINHELYKIISELRATRTEEDYISFCKKYKKLINYMPQYKDLNNNYVICSHAFINTIDFSKDERIKIDFLSSKKTLIKRFKLRENIINDKYDENIEYYYKSYEEVLKESVSTKFDTEDIHITEKISNLI